MKVLIPLLFTKGKKKKIFVNSSISNARICHFEWTEWIFRCITDTTKKYEGSPWIGKQFFFFLMSNPATPFCSSDNSLSPFWKSLSVLIYHPSFSEPWKMLHKDKANGEKLNWIKVQLNNNWCFKPFLAWIKQIGYKVQ